MFFEFGIKDFIDILLVAFVLYYTYKLMKASGSFKVFTGILVFILIWLVVTQVLEMKLLGSMTINAPTFCFPIFKQAITTGMISSCFNDSFFEPLKRRASALTCR